MAKFVVTQDMEPGFFDGVSLHPVHSVVEIPPEKYFTHVSAKMESAPDAESETGYDVEAHAVLEKVRAFREAQRSEAELIAGGAKLKAIDRVKHPFPPPPKKPKFVAPPKAKAEPSAPSGGRAADK